MPKYTPPRRKGHGAVIPPLTVYDRIDSLLKGMLSVFPKTELTEEEIEHWHQYLEPYPISGIEWAFDNWRRSGHFFPLYSDILDLVGTWKTSESQKKERKYCGECESGWVRVFEGTTAGGSPVDPKFGAMKRCQCLLQRMAA